MRRMKWATLVFVLASTVKTGLIHLLFERLWVLLLEC